MKSLLDVAKTLEVLETSGVPSSATARRRFRCSSPASRRTPCRRASTGPAQAAALCRIHWELGRTTAVLVANPPPAELALPRGGRGADRARAGRGREAGVTGPAVTPFVLARVHGGADGPSARVNQALIVANAGLAGAIAAAAAG